MKLTYLEGKFGEEASKYFLEVLNKGKTLSKKVLKVINLLEGILFTFLPKDFIEVDVINFQHGGKFKGGKKRIKIDADLYMVEKPNLDRQLAEIILDHLQKSSENVCIIEDHLSEPEDPCLSKLSSKMFFYKNEVYHFLSHQDIDHRTIIDTISAAYSIPIFIGFMTSLPIKCQKIFKYDQYILEDILNTLVTKLKGIFIVIFDGEGYLIWSKEK